MSTMSTFSSHYGPYKQTVSGQPPIENVFIFGAGASFASKAPLMSNFLNTADDLLRSGAFEEDSNEIEEVFKTKTSLGGVYRSSYLDINNIESLFGAIEMGSTLQRLGNFTGKSKISSIRKALVKMIVRTLELSINFRKNTNGVVNDIGDYNRFSEIIKELFPNSCAITFNYDLALDVSLYNQYNDINYCLNLEDNSSFKLLKLHGSTNWAQIMDKENTIVPCPIDRLIESAHSSPGRHSHSRENYKIHASKFIQSDWFTDYLSRNNYSSSRVNDVPVIVPPTWNKTEYHGTLSNVWQAASTALSTARNIYVIGYSLPESDSFFRYLFALSSLNNPSIRCFRVFNPDPKGGEVDNRFSRMIGAGIKDYYQYYPITFRAALDSVFSPK